MRIVVAGIFEEDGMILIAQRKKSLKLGLKWEFPGGKIEGNEKPEQSLKRELQEEFGIDAVIGEFFCESIYKYPDFTIKLLAFYIKSYQGDFQLNDHLQIQWVQKKDLMNFDLAAADIPIANKIMEEVNAV